MPKLNPRQMNRMMKQLGMSETKIDADEVLIRLRDGSEIKISDPQVSKIKFQGQETFTITGNTEESEGEKKQEVSDEDIKLVVEQTNASENEAREALISSSGDIAKAILEIEKRK